MTEFAAKAAYVCLLRRSGFSREQLLVGMK